MAASNSKQIGTGKIQQSPADPWRISPYSIQNNQQQQNARPSSSMMNYQIPTSQMPSNSNANIYQRCSGATVNDFCNDVDVEEFESDDRREAFISGVLFARKSNGSISAANLGNIPGQSIGGSSWRASHVIAGPHSNTLDGTQMIGLYWGMVKSK